MSENVGIRATKGDEPFNPSKKTRTDQPGGPRWWQNHNFLVFQLITFLFVNEHGRFSRFWCIYVSSCEDEIFNFNDI